MLFTGQKTCSSCLERLFGYLCSAPLACLAIVRGGYPEFFFKHLSKQLSKQGFTNKLIRIKLMCVCN